MKQSDQSAAGGHKANTATAAEIQPPDSEGAPSTRSLSCMLENVLPPFPSPAINCVEETAEPGKKVVGGQIGDKTCKLSKCVLPQFHPVHGRVETTGISYVQGFVKQNPHCHGMGPLSFRQGSHCTDS